MAEQFLQLSRDNRRDVLAIAAEKAGRPIHLKEEATDKKLTQLAGAANPKAKTKAA